MSVYDSLFLLDGLSGREKKEIISSLPDAVKLSKGELVYSSQSFPRAIALVVSGAAKAETDNAHRVVMKRFLPGMCFGAAAVFGGEAYVSRVTAETETEIQFINEDTLISLFEKYPKTAINYISFLSDKIRFLNNKLSVLSCPSAESAVFKYLVSAADTDGYAVIPENMTMLSKMLGLGRASLYRSLDSLEKNGHIKRENNKIKVINNEKTD